MFVLNTIFFTGKSIFTSDRKVDTWFCTHVHWFNTVVLTVFIFIVNLYKYQNVLKSIPSNIVSWLPVGKTIFNA